VCPFEVTAGSYYVGAAVGIENLLVLSVVATGIIGVILTATMGLRTTSDVEHQGLDINEHGEESYVLG